MPSPDQVPLITKPQLRFLQALLREHVSPGRDSEARDRRLRFLEIACERRIDSTTELTRAEAATLIDGLSALTPPPEPPADWEV
ncbi:hypothetical protein [Mycobacterium sp. SA01]|uniref:hypothetical protein n=1 Tax=Mycobacterium sp. SA01 TaxID=3238820 RepID=UPI00351AEB60